MNQTRWVVIFRLLYRVNRKHQIHQPARHPFQIHQQAVIPVWTHFSFQYLQNLSFRLVRWWWRATTCGATSWWTYSINLHKIAFNRNTSSYSKSNIRNRSITRTGTKNKNWTRRSHSKNKIKIKNDWQTSFGYFEKYCHGGRSRVQIYRFQENRPGNQRSSIIRLIHRFRALVGWCSQRLRHHLVEKSQSKRWIYHHNRKKNWLLMKLLLCGSTNIIISSIISTHI